MKLYGVKVYVAFGHSIIPEDYVEITRFVKTESYEQFINNKEYLVAFHKAFTGSSVTYDFVLDYALFLYKEGKEGKEKTYMHPAYTCAFFGCPAIDIPAEVNRFCINLKNTYIAPSA
jgi:hypothetical protein